MAGASQRGPQPSATGIAASSWMGAAPAEYTPPYLGEDGYGPAAPADPATHVVWDDLYAPGPAREGYPGADPPA
eukprot:7424928-Prorocentrum_lima.AAC.1